jgi:hypothetical protein
MPINTQLIDLKRFFEISVLNLFEQISLHLFNSVLWQQICQI